MCNEIDIQILMKKIKKVTGLFKVTCENLHRQMLIKFEGPEIL